MKLLAMMMFFLMFFTSFLVVNAFSTIMYTQRRCKRLPNGSKKSSKKIISSSTSSTATLIYNTPSSTTGLETSSEQQERISYPVQVIHQGRKTTINVHEDEPILQALERQSTIVDARVPHECRRGNCLTCASKNAKAATSNTNHKNNCNLVANVDNGLSPTIASELTKSGYVLTCCSFVTGPGVILELDQNNEVWDLVYRQRLCDGDTKQVALEAQARLLRRVDEKNVEKWKNKMKKVWSEEK